MEVTHVIRGEEWLPSTPKHIWLYESFGWEPPKFAHLPLLLNPDKTKLSKRQGDVAVDDYVKKGYLKEALLNFIAFLGWNPGTEEEVFTLEELVNEFDFKGVQKAGAVLNKEKLDWFNGMYIRKLSKEDFITKLLEYFEVHQTEIEAKADTESIKGLNEKQCEAIQTRIKTFPEAFDMVLYLNQHNPDNAVKLLPHEKMKIDLPMAKQSLEAVLADLENAADAAFEDENLNKEILIETIARLGFKNGQVLWPVRAALTAQQYSPGAFEMLVLLGKEESLKRIKATIDSI